MFTLVVLAVYGLGGIFVPLLIIRWLGYKPDTNHSLVMMISAFIGVITWSIILKFGGADGIFPSVPGMGAAFIAHFVMNHIRSPDVSPFGRYKIPKTMLNQGFVAIVVIFLISEISYLAVAPDSSESEMGGVGDYFVNGTFSGELLGEDTDYIMDGETLTIEFHTDSIDTWSNGTNVVAVLVTLTYSEDETSNGLGCAVPGASNTAPDTITGVVMHDERNGTGSGFGPAGQGSSSHEIIVEWYNSSLIGNVTGVSEKEIHDQLDVMELGLGEYVLEITVDVDTGGAVGCQHSDDGEEVEYLVELIILNYTVEKTS